MSFLDLDIRLLDARWVKGLSTEWHRWADCDPKSYSKNLSPGPFPLRPGERG